ncbi:MAG: sugar-binding domain-containing protein [Actinomycetaceae bacterium]|nr:sugar-binding domain-containing protein [Actinomycetaceae bacterium]
MNETTERIHVELLINVARRYWIEQESQAKIAEEIGYSRSMVSRLLDEARRREIITFTVSHPLERAIELEQNLAERFGLDCARVALSPADVRPSETLRLAAELLRERLTADSVLAITNGRTVSGVVSEFIPTRKPHATVVQAIGSIARDNHIVDSPEICLAMADRLKSSYQLLPAPLIVRSATVAAALRKEGSVSMTTAMASHADVLITGIGATSPGSDGIIFRHLISRAEHEELLAAGAVGHICGHHIDASGRHIDNDLCRRILAIPFDRLAGIEHLIAVAWGREKVQAIRASLKCGYVNHFVTDMETARLVLDGDG